MGRRFVVAPEATFDLLEIWRYISAASNAAIADRVEAEIRSRFSLLASMPGVGHSRRDLTPENVRFFPVYSYLILYRAETDPLQIVAILHGRRDVAKILKDRG